MTSYVHVSIAIIVLVFVIFIAFYRYYSTYSHFLLNQNKELKIINDSLQTDKLEYIGKLHTITEQNSYLKQELNNQNNIDQKALELAKNGIMQFGNKLAHDFFVTHQEQSNQNKKLTEDSIVKTSEKINQEFCKIVETLSILQNEVTQSKNNVENLKQSLSSPITTGKLAEVILGNILQSSGLRPQIDFILQPTFDSEDKTKLRPDAIVLLPNNKIVIIDAKSSKFLLDSDSKDTQLSNNFIKTMHTHLKSLNSKDYTQVVSKHYNYNETIILMFLPTEAAIEKITMLDPTFMTKSWNFNIFPVGPSGLMNMLSLIRQQINDNLKNQNYHEILVETKKMLTNLLLLIEPAYKIGTTVSNLVNHYDKFATIFNKNFINKIHELNHLGLDISKSEILGKALPRYIINSYNLTTAKNNVLELNSEKTKEK